MVWTRAALGLVAVAAVAVALVSGGSSADPRTPGALPGMPPPYLGTAVVGGGGLTAAIDAYGDVVDLRAPGPAGRALIDNTAARQLAGTVAPGTGIVPRVRIGDRPALPFWRADSVSQRYLAGTDVVRTTARFGPVRVTVVAAADARRLALLVRARGTTSEGIVPSVSVDTDGAACRSAVDGGTLGLLCMASAVPLSRRFLASQPSNVALYARRGESLFIVAAKAIVARAAAADRAWLAGAKPLGGAPAWARSAYRRSLLTLRALTDRRTGAVAAGARDGWAYVWPRDAGTAAIAFAAAGYRPEARRVARFLLGLDLDAAARFQGDGTPVAGRAAQGDAAGWTDAAAAAAGLRARVAPLPWRERADYQEGDPGDYLGDAIAAQRPAATIAAGFATPAGLLRRRHHSTSGLDSAAAWAVRPFARPALFPAVRRTLLSLLENGTRYGITPGSAWPGSDPWTAPTAWSAWALAALSGRARRAGGPAEAVADRRAGLRLLAGLRHAATPAGDLPERVDARTGVPRSTTPLAWSHAFAILALRELWPSRAGASD